MDNTIGGDMIFSVTGGTIDIERFSDGKIEMTDFSAGVSSISVDIVFDEFFIAPASGPRVDAPWGVAVYAGGGAVNSTGRISYNDVHHFVGTTPGNTPGRHTPVLAPGVHPLTSGGLIGGLINSAAWNYNSTGLLTGEFTIRPSFRSINGLDVDNDGSFPAYVNNNAILEESEYNYVRSITVDFIADDGIAGNGVDTFAAGSSFVFSLSGAQNHFSSSSPDLSISSTVPEPSSLLMGAMGLVGLLVRRRR